MGPRGCMYIGRHVLVTGEDEASKEAMRLFVEAEARLADECGRRLERRSRALKKEDGGIWDRGVKGEVG